MRFHYLCVQAYFIENIAAHIPRLIVIAQKISRIALQEYLIKIVQLSIAKFI